MSDKNEIQGVYAPNVLDFVRSANEYCSWIEKADAEDATAFIQNAVRKLSSVYSHAVCLEELEPLMESGNEKFVSEQDWSQIYQKVFNLLGTHNSYLRIAEGDEFDRSDLVTHTISEDIADIYQDLKDFTLQYRQGMEEIMNDAIWEVMDNFDHYWSDKLLNALHALNRLYVGKIDPESFNKDSIEQDNESNPSYDNSFFTRLQDQNEEEV